MNTPAAIVIGSALIALEIYLGLTHDKRTYMEFCRAKYSVDACEQGYRR